MTARLTPSQLELALGADLGAGGRQRRRRRRPAADEPPLELDLGPVPRRPKPRPGPRWPAFVAIREDVPEEAAAGAPARPRARQQRDQAS